MVTTLRTLLSDKQSVGFPDDSELLNYLDRATVFYCEQMASMKDPSLLKETPVVGDMALPDDFITLAGQHPVIIKGRNVSYYGSIPYPITYFAYLPLPSSYAASATVEHTASQDAIIIEVARGYAMNRNEYDITQDLKLTDMWQSAASGARRRANEPNKGSAG